MDEIFAIIRQEVKDFTDNYIEVVPGYEFSHYDTIKRIHLTKNSKFENDEEYGGREKLYYNISNKRKNDVASFLDVDTNQIRVEELVPQSYIPSRIIENKLKEIIKRDRYTEKFNQLADDLASFGYVAMEHQKDESVIIDLRRLFVDPTVETINDSRFITIQEFYTADQLREKVELGWDADAIEKIIEKVEGRRDGAPESYQDEGTQNDIISAGYITIYRRFGIMPKGLVEGGQSQEDIRSYVVAAEPFLTRTTQTGEEVSNGEVLFKGQWKDEYPFEDVKLFATKGRLLGIGVYEMLFEPQERMNEIMNQRRISMEISAMHIFQTADPLVFNNILTDLENGSVIKTKVQGSLAPLVNEERNLSAFQMEEASYMQNADEIVSAGGLQEDAPTSMPATNAAIIQNNTLRIQAIRRENFVAFIRRFINRFILPKAIEELDNDDVFKYVGEAADMDALDMLVLENRFADHQVAMALKGTPVLAPFVEEERAKIAKKFKGEGQSRYIRSIKDYWKKHQDSFDVNIDAEQRDVSTIANNTFAFITAYAQNPGLLSDPVQREFARQWAKDIGLDTARLDIALQKRDALIGEQRQEQQQKRGTIKAETEDVVNKDEEVEVQ